MVEIELSQGLVAIIDDTDAHVVQPYRWFAKKNKRTFYAARSIRRTDGTVTTQYMHTLLTGWPRVDHRDGDGLNNRRENLRRATDVQNARNGRQRKHSSRFKGVTWNKAGRRWRAQIGRTYLGQFEDEEVAARVYDGAARRSFGEFAALNFPGPNERAA